MAMTSVQIGRGRSGTRFVARPEVQRGLAGSLRLVAIAGLVSVVGSLATAAGVALPVGAAAGSWDAVGGVASLGLPFMAITLPTTGIWLHGAIQTRRTIRRVAVLTDAADRAAFAELNVLLARES